MSSQQYPQENQADTSEEYAIPERWARANHVDACLCAFCQPNLDWDEQAVVTENTVPIQYVSIWDVMDIHYDAFLEET